MSRRASSSLHPGVYIGIAAAIALAVFGVRHFIGKREAGITGVNPINITDFMENGNSLRGSEYSVEGKIEEKLRWTTDRGQIISLRVKSPAGDELIPVEIPPDVAKSNIEREQRYAMKVRVRQGGILVATRIIRL